MFCPCGYPAVITVHHEVFSADALEARVRRKSAFRAPAGKTECCTVDYINHQGSFVFIIHPT